MKTHNFLSLIAHYHLARAQIVWHCYSFVHLILFKLISLQNILMDYLWSDFVLAFVACHSSN